ncbi:reverse transcriptase family protein [Phytohabitans aurantiacus]|uniref:Uncharacterized protein n=1 Tax=Phytohabitans aurantiacus TaxID=3016789 RepID=A0ABQ5QMV3_9ACTN|nr:hypothetical protein [Phytohabitans aurantiacus]GLH95600.1 hypothetical protein Pa4123_08720 [Phytohabitans aurantiacus]
MSAVLAIPAAGGSILDPVRALQHALYRAAKADPGRRFHALRDKVFRRDVLWRARVAVRRNNGAPGIDMTTLAEVEQYGVARLLDELASELRDGRWRPLPARRVFIPKPGTNEQRPLSIPVDIAITSFPCSRGTSAYLHADQKPNLTITVNHQARQVAEAIVSQQDQLREAQRQRPEGPATRPCAP